LLLYKTKLFQATAHRYLDAGVLGEIPSNRVDIVTTLFGKIEVPRSPNPENRRNLHDLRRAEGLFTPNMGYLYEQPLPTVLKQRLRT